jgi:transcriptional regulator NrdR family protein
MDVSYFTCLTRGLVVTKLPPKMSCGLCINGLAYLHSGTVIYKGKPYISFYYKCNRCNEEFTTTESDEETMIPIIPQMKRKQNMLDIIKTTFRVSEQNET